MGSGDNADWVEKGNALSALGRHEEALAAYERAAEVDPDYAYGWTRQGSALGQLGRHAEALAAYERATEVDPNYGYGWQGKGDSLGALGRHAEALAAYERATEVDPNYVYGWQGKGDSLRQLRRHAEALAAYERATEVDPNYVYGWQGKGDSLRQLRRHAEALAAYERATEVDSDYVYGWTGKGNALGQLGRHEKALAAYERATEVDPNYVYGWDYKGDALSALGRHEEALAAYERATEVDPGNVYGWTGKGNALSALGRNEEALVAAASVRRIEAKHLRSLGHMLQMLGRHEDALAEYEQAGVLDPEDTSVWRAKGDALKALGRYDEALDAYDEATDLDPEYTWAWRAKGHALKALGRHEEALAAYDEIWNRPRALLGNGRGKRGEAVEIWYDPDYRLPNPHLMITGETGSGKTQATKAILADLAPSGVPVLILDFKDDYSGPAYAEAESLTVHDPNEQSLPFNPLAPPVDPRSGRVSPTHHAHQLTEIIKRIYRLGDQQAYRLREAVKSVYEEAGVPWRPFVPKAGQKYPPFKAVQDELALYGNSNALLGRMSPIFDLELFSSRAEATDFAGLVEHSTVIRLAQLPGDEVKNSVAEFFLMVLYNYLIRQRQSFRLSRLLVLDEAWRLVKSPFLEPLMREGRAFGLGVVIASQFPNDLPPVVSGSTATKLYFSQTNVEQVRNIQRTILGKTTGTEADRLASVMRGLPPLACVVYSKQLAAFAEVLIDPYFSRQR